MGVPIRVAKPASRGDNLGHQSSGLRRAAGFGSESRRLQLWADVHACFLWVGLWQFWKRAGGHTERGPAIAARAREGFAGEACLDNIPAEGMRILNPAAIEALRTMVEEANARS